MNPNVLDVDATSSVAALEDAVDALLAGSLDSCSDVDVSDLWRRLEVARRRLDAVEVRVIGAVQTRSLPFAQGCKSTIDLARYLLHLSPAEASLRVRNTANLTARVMPSGEAVPPVYPVVAAALDAGSISGRAADVITKTVDKLDPVLSPGAEGAVEQVLVDFAADHDQSLLTTHARDLRQALDQESGYHEAELRQRQRRRDLTLSRRPDGSGTLTAELTAHAAELCETVLDALSAPQPAADGVRDPRTAGQRRHDGFATGLQLLLSSGRLPSTAGCATTLVLRCDADTFATSHARHSTGSMVTGHGYSIPAAIAKTWLDPEARAIAVLLSDAKGIDAYSSTQRLFTEQQRLAMIARDGGCTYWGCDSPTRLDPSPPCHRPRPHRTHPRRRRRLGPRTRPPIIRLDGLHQHHDPRPTPLDPTETLDPQQTPRRNHLHDRS